MHGTCRVAPVVLLSMMACQASICRSGDQVAVEEEGQVAEGYPEAVVAEVRSGDTTTIHSGTIEVRTGQRIQLLTPGGGAHTGVISIGYTGTHAAHCCWLQFIWREVLVTTAAGTTALPESVTTSSGTYNLTTDPAHPNYNVDSSSRSEPCYEAANASNDAAGLVIFDIPRKTANAARAARAAGVLKVESIAHFDSFFICGGTVLVHVSWTATYTWTPSGGWHGPDYVVSPPDTSGAPPSDEQRKRLSAAYPGQTVLP